MRQKLEHLGKAEGDKTKFNAEDFAPVLEPLGGDLVNEDAYDEAAAAGAKAVGKDVTINHGEIAAKRSHIVSRYADRVGGRIAVNLATTLNNMGSHDSLDDVYARLNAKLEALGSDVTRYSLPPWSVGNEAYGSQLHDHGVLVDWELDDGIDNHCEDCPAIADGSPYDETTLPTWPGQGETACLDRCYCRIVANNDSWNEVFGEEAA